MSSSYWFYSPDTHKRTLLLQYSVKPDAKPDDAKKTIRSLGVKAAQELHAKKCDDVEIIFSDKIEQDLHGIFANSFHLTNYEFSLRTAPEVDQEAEKKAQSEADYDSRGKKYLKVIQNVDISNSSKQGYKDDFDYKFWVTSAKATKYARDLTNTRGTVATPEYMEERVRELIAGNANIKDFRVIKGDQLLEKGMNLFYNVGMGSVSEPRCITLLYKGNPESDEVDISFVGKGLTFDTGGLNLKPTGSIEDMYYDKAGACAVMGALQGTIAMGSKQNIVFAMGFAENSIDNKSYKPMDIIKSMKGLTVEIGNTDAEGRLVLADTLSYVQKEYKPKKIVDLATLTGAIMVALGNETAGIFSNDDEFAQEIKDSGKNVFEQYWQMPITQESKDAIKGAAADISNSGKSRWGGSSKAAAFLERFIEKGTKWVHLDIAGAGNVQGAKAPLCPDGNGFGTQTLLHYLYKDQLKK